MDIPIDKLYKGELIPLTDVKRICQKEVLIEETNVVNSSLPVIVCGDIHGQFLDLLQIFELGGHIPDTNYLFLGDYVNRGYDSVQCILLLYGLKIKYPNRMTLLRGNHESWNITQVYGFYDECERKYPESNIWQYFCETFNYLPLASILNNQYFCVHAGLSPNMENIRDLKKVQRFQEVPHEGIITDVLWSDPEQIFGWQVVPKGAGYIFGPDITQQFLFQHNFNKIIRAHQLFQTGYQQMHNNNLISIFSAPNYCYRCGNEGSIVQIDQHSTRTCISYQRSTNKEKITISKEQSLE